MATTSMGTAYSLPRRRLYDAEVGRFASADPIGLAGGDHRFVYVGGNPTAGVDPSGLVAYSAEPYAGGTGMGQREAAIGAAYGNSAGWAATRGAISGSPAWMGVGAGGASGVFGGER